MLPDQRRTVGWSAHRHCDVFASGASVHAEGTATLLRAIAASGLPGCMLPWPQKPLDDLCWRHLLIRVDEHRLSGLLLHALDSKALPATARQLHQAQRLHARAVGEALLRDAALLEIAGALDQADVTWRALKGAATAYLVYADPAMRPYREVSVLVSAARFDDALRVLGEFGYQRSCPPLKPGFDGTFGKAVSLVRADGMAVNVQRTLIPGPFGLTLHSDSLFQKATVFSVGGRPITALAPETHFLHSCYHVALGSIPMP